MKRFVLGSRGSPLALVQARTVLGRLQEANSGTQFVLETVKTLGDRDRSTSLSGFAGTGVFVKELQSALMEGVIDCAVHSLKDVPDREPEGLELTAFPGREDPRDALISGGRAFADLPRGARIGTDSPRRVAQLKGMRGDLEFRGLRGNLHTRLKRVREGELDAVVLAVAGLVRLGLDGHITQVFSFEELVPAIGQGCLALECRLEDGESRKIARSINDASAESCVKAEREFMARMGGGCKVPMACHGYPSGTGMRMLAMLAHPKTGAMERVEKEGKADALPSLVEGLCGEMEARCIKAGIPLPRDLPEDYLLQFMPSSTD